MIRHRQIWETCGWNLWLAVLLNLYGPGQPSEKNSRRGSGLKGVKKSCRYFHYHVWVQQLSLLYSHRIQQATNDLAGKTTAMLKQMSSYCVGNSPTAVSGNSNEQWFIHINASFLG